MFDWLRRKGADAPAAGAPATPRAQPGVEQALAARALAAQHLAQDRFEQAAACYRQALALGAPEDAAALLNHGFALCSLGRGAEAREILQQAVALQPANHDAHYFLGLACEQCGEPAAAAGCYQRAVSLRPDFDVGLRDLCRVLVQAGQLEQAQAALRQGLAANPANAELHFYQGNLALQQGQYAQAVPSFERALALQPAMAPVHAALAQARAGLQQWEAAVAGYRQALALAPNDGQVHNLLGTALVRTGRLGDAVASFRQAVTLQPQDDQAHSNLGNALRIQGELAEAVRHCQEAVRLAPSRASAHNNLGAALMEQGDTSRALAAFDTAISLEPGYAEAHSNRGVVLATLSRGTEALASHRQAIELAPGGPQAFVGQGKTLLGLDRPQDALASFDRALQLHPGHAEALDARGLALKRLGRLEEALVSHDAALRADPQLVEALNNRGNLLADLHRFDEAISSYDEALRLRANYAAAGYNRGNALRTTARVDEAIASYEQALRLQPRLPFLYGNLLHARMQMCDWSTLAGDFREVAERVEDGQVFNPFTIIPTDLPAAAQRRAVESYVRHQFPHAADRQALRVPRGRARIRVGYFSADFHEHATAYLMAGLFEQHDREQFEWIAFSFGPTTPSATRSRLEAAFDRFLVVNGKSDEEIARAARELELDIAVDLKGYTQDCRPGIFAAGVAPVQVNYLGFPGTMGAPFIDYLIADAVVVPPHLRAGYAEKIVTLPDSYQVNDDRRAISPKTYTRAEVGLPEQGFVFCCFNNNYKITPLIFDVWMRLLQQVEGSVLWLLEGSPRAAQNLRREAARRGVGPGRLVFAGRMQLPEHLARQRLAGLFLDTIYCNAHTTASDALWAGLPVLTCPGDTFASRVAASLLHAIGLPELVVPSLEEYEHMARHLATCPDALAALQARLAGAAQTPLFDTRRFARNIEAAYLRMADRSRLGLLPEHLEVPPAGLTAHV